MNELARILMRRIGEEGPISVADYMAASAAHYYGSRDPLGQRGDFVTAPEISQMFGELVGLWCAETWQTMGSPAEFVLAELGPGRGTLMRDALRAASRVPGFRSAAQLHLVETADAMRAAQGTALADQAPHWHDRAEQLPDGPVILIANEFLDALPIRQFIRAADGWHERRIGVSADRLVFVMEAGIFPGEANVPIGAIREVGPEALAWATWLGRHVARQGGAALLIDYGYAGGGFGDTLQALRAHRRADVLSDPGEADLTAHVDFAAVIAAAEGAGARCHGPIEQGRFLRRLGIDVRAAQLTAQATDQQATAIAAAYRRLVDPHAMGTLFKVVALANAGLPALAGFEKVSA